MRLLYLGVIVLKFQIIKHLALVLIHQLLGVFNLVVAAAITVIYTRSPTSRGLFTNGKQTLTPVPWERLQQVIKPV